jgi:hypothetical protein
MPYLTRMVSRLSSSFRPRLTWWVADHQRPVAAERGVIRLTAAAARHQRGGHWRQQNGGICGLLLMHVVQPSRRLLKRTAVVRHGDKRLTYTHQNRPSERTKNWQHTQAMPQHRALPCMSACVFDIIRCCNAAFFVFLHRKPLSMKYDSVDSFLAQVAQRNPGQPEFLQAVTEVMESLWPFIEKHPRYAEHGLLERLVEPERT